MARSENPEQFKKQNNRKANSEEFQKKHSFFLLYGHTIFYWLWGSMRLQKIKLFYYQNIRKFSFHHCSYLKSFKKTFSGNIAHVMSEL